jgi:hypothetical protein
VPAEPLETAFVEWLSTCHPDERLETAARELLHRGLHQRQVPAREWNGRRHVKELKERRQRTALVFRMGLISESQFRAEVEALEQQIAQVKAQPAAATSREFSARLTDLVAAWQDATSEQRARLAASIVTEITLAGGRMSSVRPRPAWAPYFEELLVSHGAGDEGLPRNPHSASRSSGSIYVPIGRRRQCWVLERRPGTLAAVNAAVLRIRAGNRTRTQAGHNLEWQGMASEFWSQRVSA